MSPEDAKNGLLYGSQGHGWDVDAWSAKSGDSPCITIDGEGYYEYVSLSLDEAQSVHDRLGLAIEALKGGE